MYRNISVHKRITLSALLVLLMLGATLTALFASHASSRAQAAGTLEGTFQQAAQDFKVPENLLKAICQKESHISIRSGQPSVDGAYGCRLVKTSPDTSEQAARNHADSLDQEPKKHTGTLTQAAKKSSIDTLDQAAKKLGVSPQQLQQDLAMNIRGTAYILSDDAQQLSSTHQLPTTLAGWRPAVEILSNARSRFAAHLYASQVYKLLQDGFSTTTESGEVITVQPQRMSADATTINSNVDPAAVADLPPGCSNDGKTDYPGAVDCILDPAQHDCDLVLGTNAPCNYFSSSHYGPTYRQNDGTITHVVIHDIEGSAAAAINTFEDPNSNVTAHYIVDSDGTVYQTVREKDVAFQAGNLWFNQHSIGIEHDGFDATGFQYYNAAEYQGSAKLTAYLVQKYNIPVDHTRIVSHGTIPAPNLANTPNNVDPGPYWLWDYYLKQVRTQEKQLDQPAIALSKKSHIITLHPVTARKLLGGGGTESPANFNFFYLYNGPSTKSGLIPQEGTGSDITDETNNVEPDMSYYYMDKVKDPAGTGDMLYEIWYGESDQAHATTPSFFTHAKLAWLAVPSDTAFQGKGTVVTLKSSDGMPVQVSGSPKSNTAATDYHIGDAPDGAVFVSGYKVVEDGTTNVWYSINYNHRQTWVPASSVVETPQP